MTKIRVGIAVLVAALLLVGLKSIFSSSGSKASDPRAGVHRPLDQIIKSPRQMPIVQA